MDPCPGCGTMIAMVRTFAMIALSLALASPAGAQVFKPRGGSGSTGSSGATAKKPAKKSAKKRHATASSDSDSDSSDSDSDSGDAPPKKPTKKHVAARRTASKHKAAKKGDADFVQITDDDD